jgi:hypothetical protein
MSLFFPNQLQQLVQILFETLEDTIGVLSSPMVLIKAVHGFGKGNCRENAATRVVMVDENHAELWLQLHCLGEHLHKLVHQSFALGNVGVVNKNDSLGVLLDGTPALFVFEIAGNVP